MIPDELKAIKARHSERTTLRERSKYDNAIIVGSEVRQLCSEVDALVAEVERLGLAEKTWRGRAEKNAADRDTAQSALEAAQARERVLREAMKEIHDALEASLVHSRAWADVYDRACAALTTPADDSALREAIGKAWHEGSVAAFRETLAMLKAEPGTDFVAALRELLTRVAMRILASARAGGFVIDGHEVAKHVDAVMKGAP